MSKSTPLVIGSCGAKKHATERVRNQLYSLACPTTDGHFLLRRHRKGFFVRVFFCVKACSGSEHKVPDKEFLSLGLKSILKVGGDFYALDCVLIPRPDHICDDEIPSAKVAYISRFAR